MDLIELTPDYNLSDFDCGDEDLNDFTLTYNPLVLHCLTLGGRLVDAEGIGRFTNLLNHSYSTSFAHRRGTTYTAYCISRTGHGVPLSRMLQRIHK